MVLMPTFQPEKDPFVWLQVWDHNNHIQNEGSLSCTEDKVLGCSYFTDYYLPLGEI